MDTLKTYWWKCGIANSGAIVVVARTVEEARALVRAAPSYESAASTFEACISVSAKITHGAHVVGM